MKIQRLIGALGAALFFVTSALATEQASYVTPATGPMAMATFVTTYLNPGLRALASCSWGPTAPANGPASSPIAYQCWADTSGAPVLVKTWDGTAWSITGALDTAAHTWTPYRQGAAIVAVATSGSAADLSTGTLPAARLPNPSVSTLGGTQSKTCSSSNWLNAISTSGVPACSQPSFADLTSSIACSQLPSQTGDVTRSAGSCAATLVNIPDGTPAVGSILRTNIAAPATPAAGKTATYVDSTAKRFHDKNDAGSVGTTVVGDAGAANNFLTAIDPSTGAVSKARPACASLSDASVFCSGTSAANLTGTLAAAQFPALTGDVTTTAGALAASIQPGVVTNAKFASMAAATIKCNATGSSAAPTDCAAALARSSAVLNIENATSTGDANYAIQAADRAVYHTALTAARTDTLPAAASLNPGQLLVIADWRGVVTATNTISAARNGATTDTINGLTSTPVVSAQYGAAILMSDGVSRWTMFTGSSGGGGGSGSVVQVNSGTGLVGGPINTTGTLSADPAVFQNYKSGLTLSTAGSSSSFGISTGVATDSGNTAFMVLGSAFTKTTGAWSAGSAAGGLDTGTIAASTWYHAFLMRRPDTTAVDVCISVTVSGCTTGTNIPSAYTQFRRIGSMKTNGSSQWIKFYQQGNLFLWDAPPLDVSTLTIGTTAADLSLSIPPGVRSQARVVAINATTGGFRIMLYSPDVADNAASGTNGNVLYNGASGVNPTQVDVWSGISSQVRGIAEAAGQSLSVRTLGWSDTFGGTSGPGAVATEPAARVLQGYINGLTLSTAGSSASFGVNTGSATDSGNTAFIVLANALTKTTSAWASGTSAGALDAGTIAINTWYKVFLIQRPDTNVQDVCITVNALATGCTVGTTIPAAYSSQRYIGSLLTNGSSQWVKFIQDGSLFTWDVPVADVNASNPGIAAVTRALTVPNGVRVAANLSVAAFASTSGDSALAIYISDLSVADTTASITTASTFNTNAGAGAIGGVATVMTNTTRQVRSRLQQSAAGTTLEILTLGYTDNRGGPGGFGGGSATPLAQGVTAVSGVPAGYALTNNGGALGSALVSSSGGDLNKFRNPTFDVWQRGTSALATATAAPGNYTADGWRVQQAGAAFTCAQDTGAGAGLPLFSLKCVGGTSNTSTIVSQRIESYTAAPLAGQVVTVQFRYKQSSGIAVTPKISSCFASAQDNFTTCTADLASTSLTSCASGSWCVESYTFTASASAGFGYQLSIDCNTALTAAQACWIAVADIRVTPGVAVGINANPPAPEQRPIQIELALNQRFYYRRNAISATTDSFAMLRAYSTGSAYGKLVDLPVTMRATPTPSVSSPSHLSDDSPTGTTAAISAIALIGSPHSILVSGGITGGATLSAGAVTVISFNTLSGWIDSSAEL